MMLRVCALLGLFVAAQSIQVTPMEKVIGLLKDLSAKVTAEGAKEAAGYDKFACFCKEQADGKLYSIEKSDDKIADLSAEIKELTAAIAALNSDIGKLAKKISALDSEIKRKTAKRDKEHEVYEGRAKDMNEAIDACGAAIDALRDSKKEMSGAKVDLVQVKSALVKAAQSVGSVALLSKLNGAPKFEYQSNDIIATLDDLLADFKGMKKDLDVEEFDTNSAFETDKLGLENEKQFAEKDKAEKEAISEAKTEDNEAAKSDRDDERDDRNADQAFLDELTTQCETKARQFDKRSTTRADELTALSDATKELQEGAVPNFESNKKLVGLQKSVVLNKASPASFVQISNVQHQKSGKDAVLQRVRSFLDDAAERSGSGVISALAMRVAVAEDHFVKVRGLIKDLIAKLKADAKSEATQKRICDTDMAKAISDRDTANAKIEAANAKITTENAKKDGLEDEIQTLTENISALKKELLEATELRNDDKAENKKTIAMSEDGGKSVKLALGILQKFYKKAQFVQEGKYTPPKSDRDGNTVGDLAPDAGFDSGSGVSAQSESKGIVGILEVILSDFERTTKTTKKEEKADQAEFDKMEKETNASVKKKQNRIKKAQGLVKGAEAEILAQEGALKDAKDLLDSGLSKLEDLEAMCVKGEETWEERKAKREEEIEALKSALTILEDWQA